jgi:hypothetical protein
MEVGTLCSGPGASPLPQVTVQIKRLRQPIIVFAVACRIAFSSRQYLWNARPAAAGALNESVIGSDDDKSWCTFNTIFQPSSRRRHV